MGSIHLESEHLKVDGYNYNYLHKIFSHQDREFFEKQFHFAKIYREHHDGELPHNLFWDYLRVKHDLHHLRFDHYHPIVGHWIEKEPKPFIHTGSISEPNSIILFGIFIIFGIFKWRKLKI